MLPLVSVVVPIYKVEKYLERCINSVVNQTYTNIEVILVNDGSPDQCGEIAENYAKEDTRIIVIHKENGGLSDARNVGVEKVTGEFTMFVDSDDWLDKSMIEKLVHYSLTYKADVAQSAFYYAHEKYLLYDNRFFSKVDPPLVLNRRKLMEELVMNERVKNFAWGKLYKTDLIRDLPFKKGVLFEDVFWAHQVMDRVDQYVMCHEPLYYYLQRDDSIVANYSVGNLDILKGLKERHSFIRDTYKELVNESYKMILKTSLIHYNLLVLNRGRDKKRTYRREIQTYIRENYSQINKAVKDDIELRKQLQLFTIHPYLNICLLISKKIQMKFRLKQKANKLERINI